MTTHILAMVYSWPFALCFAIGIAAQRVYIHQRCRYLDHHHPLPQGRKRYVARIDRMWLAGLCALGSLGFVLYAAERSYDYAKALGDHQAQCNEDFRRALVARAEANDATDQFTAAEVDANARWIAVIAEPPSSIATLPVGSNEYRAWIRGTAREHLAEIQAIEDERDKAIAFKRAHPLPEIQCGK